MKRTIFATLLMLLASAATAAETVREFSGSGNMTTPMFTVESPWIIDWRLDGDYDSMVALDVTLVEARTGRHIGRVLHTKYKGNGVKLFRESGTFQLRISATFARWRFKVQQLTDEEAKLYTPRRPN